jgi:hypothetical protein
MTCGSSILASLVFGPRRVSTEGIARPTKTIAWRGPGARLDVQGKDSRRPSRIRARLGFIQTDSICTLLGGQSRDPTFAYKRLGGRSCSGWTLFAIIHLSARILESSPLSARSNLRPRCNTTIVTTPSIKSHYPTRGPNLGKTCVSLCRLIAVEFAGSHKRSMIRKPSSMGIAGVEPRQQGCGGTTPRCCYNVEITNVEGTTSTCCSRYRSRGGALDIALGVGLSRV